MKKPMSEAKPPVIDALTLILLGVGALALTLLEVVVGSSISLLEDLHAIPKSTAVEAAAFVIAALAFSNAVTLSMLREERRNRR